MKSTLKKVEVVVAVIGAFATVVGAIVGAPFISDWLSGSKDSRDQVFVRVSGSTGASISGANVLLFFEDNVVSGYTDTNGAVNFDVNVKEGAKARIVVETENYEIYEREIYDLSNSQNVDIRLKPRPTDIGTVIVRVIDERDSEPIVAAKVLLLVAGDIYNQLTDSNGIAKFTIKFSSDAIEAEMSVSTSNYEIEYQRITLLPNRIQDVQLNPQTGDISSSPVQISTSIAEEPSTSVSNNDSVSSVIDVESLIAHQIEIGEGATEPGQGLLNVSLFKGDGTPSVGDRFRVYKQQQDLAGNWVVDGGSIAYRDTNSTGVVSFDLDSGMYILNSDFTGYNWGDAHDVKGIPNVQIESGKITNVRIELARLVVGFLRADNTAIKGQRVRIYLQKKDLAGNWVIDGSSVAYRDTDNTGTVVFNLAPGRYIIQSDLNGYNWGNAYDVMGMADFALPSGEVTELILHLGKLTVGVTNDAGNPLNGKRVRVFLQKSDVNDNVAVGDMAVYGNTDNTGTVSFNLTPGFYAVQVDDVYEYDVLVKAGETILIEK